MASSISPPSKEAASALGLGPLLELGDTGLEDLGEQPRSYPQEWNQSSSCMAADKVLSGGVSLRTDELIFGG